MELEDHDTNAMITKLQSACSHLESILKSSINIDSTYEEVDERLESIQEKLNTSSRRLAPLQSMSIASKALETRINRAISPGLSLLESFKLNESLQRKLLNIANHLLSEKNPRKRLKKLIKYVECVDKLNESINAIGQESEPAIQKLQEVVEFLSRTKATDRYRTEHLTETLVTLKAICETEIEAMRFDGVLDEALLNLQDEYEGLLQKLRHDDHKGSSDHGMGSDLEIQILTKISHTLAENDCLDICIDIFVKVRYRRAAKALMKLSPDYLKKYTPEEIDEMEWESLETSISLWIQHFHLAVTSVLVSEKILCSRVLADMGPMIWPECYIKIADKIMAVFFRFGEGVARSNKEPQKLFKLLDMFDSLEKLKPEFALVFEGESGADICSRFRELEKLLVHASTRVFWEFGLQIEGNQDGLPSTQDGSVPKLVRYAVNYLKNLTMDSYSLPMEMVLQTELSWKGGPLPADHENDRGLLKDAVSNVMEAIQRNIEAQKARIKDKILAQIFSMNTYWYIYMRTKNTELGKLVGEQYMKRRYRNAAEESAYQYQKQAWGGLVKILEREEGVRERMEAFMGGFDEMWKRHRSSYKIVSEADLRDQMKDATVRLVLPVYKEFVDRHSAVLIKNKYPSPASIESLLREIFESGDVDGKHNLTRTDSGGPRMSGERVRTPRFSKDYRTTEFDDSD